MSGRKDQGRPKTRSESSGLRLSATNVPRPLATSATSTPHPLQANTREAFHLIEPRTAGGEVENRFTVALLL
jgi:hypothetical protein